MASIAMPLSSPPSKASSAKIWMLICDLSGDQIALPRCAGRMRRTMMWKHLLAGEGTLCERSHATKPVPGH